MVRLLEGIYEADFHEFFYGCRRGESCHQALDALWKQLMSGMQWLIDADISDYFTSIDHAHLREFLSQRIADQSIMRIIGKWLNAGVLEEKTLTYPKGGVPQGGVVSPLLSNVYLHYVLDEWFVKEVKPRLGPDPTVVSLGAIWIVEAAVVSIKACVARVVSWLDSDTFPGFHRGLRVAEL